jgi:hypothetical protein
LLDSHEASHFARQRVIVSAAQRAHAKRVQNLLYFCRISQHRGIFIKMIRPSTHIFFCNVPPFTRALLEECIKPAIYRCDVNG